LSGCHVGCTFAHFDGDHEDSLISYNSNRASFVACIFIHNNIHGTVLGATGGRVRLEGCTFENNTVFQHILSSCGITFPFYSDTPLNGGCSAYEYQTQPLAALPAGSGMLTAEDPYLTGLRQVCAELMPNLHGATKSLIQYPSWLAT
jgi:hypothetical protein